MAQVNLLTISNSELVSTVKNDSLGLIASSLYKNGFNINTNNCISIDSGVIEANIKQGLEGSDCLILCTESQLDTSYLTKKIIAKIAGEELITNVYAKNNIAVYYKKMNMPQSKEDMSFAYMPKSARAITNELGVMQGFLMSTADKIIVFMPLEAIQLKTVFVTSVLPYLIDKYNKRNRVSIFKTFGLSGSELMSLLKDLRKNKQKVEIICNEKYLDGEIIINYPDKLDQVVVDGFISTAYKRLAPYVYAETDTTLQERLFEILSVSKSTLAIAEDATSGNIISLFYKHNLEAQLALIEAYFVPTNQSKIKILGVEKEALLKDKALIDGSDVVYQMAVGVLENAGSDYIAATYVKENTLYVAMGNTDGIHVLSQVFDGDRDEQVQKFTNFTFFNLIKKIKKNDFHLPQTTI